MWKEHPPPPWSSSGEGSSLISFFPFLSRLSLFLGDNISLLHISYSLLYHLIKLCLHLGLFTCVYVCVFAEKKYHCRAPCPLTNIKVVKAHFPLNTSASIVALSHRCTSTPCLCSILNLMLAACLQNIFWGKKAIFNIKKVF